MFEMEIKKKAWPELFQKMLEGKKKADLKTVIAGVESGKAYEEYNLKPFFRLHPPRGGIEI